MNVLRGVKALASDCLLEDQSEMNRGMLSSTSPLKNLKRSIVVMFDNTCKKKGYTK